MAQRTFVAWVEPVAVVLAEDRRLVIDFTRSVRRDIWEWDSGVEGWTCKDILAHLAGGNDQLSQTLLRKVVACEPLEASVMDVDTDGENARRVAERRSWAVERLIAELQTDGDEVQELLSRLTEDDEQLRDGLPMTLGAFLQIVLHERHDWEHLEQLRGALR
ncbi:MAG: maleylpyruvate isomerase N-terminal domain-containing protein [Dehalococcoidia bacterium]